MPGLEILRAVIPKRVIRFSPGKSQVLRQTHPVIFSARMFTPKSKRFLALLGRDPLPVGQILDRQDGLEARLSFQDGPAQFRMRAQVGKNNALIWDRLENPGKARPAQAAVIHHHSHLIGCAWASPTWSELNPSQ